MSNIEFYKLDISGNTFTCSSSGNTYTTKNISSSNYTWSADFFSISGSGYSVTGTGSGNGQGNIRVAIASPYSGTTIRGALPVWVGTPLPSVTGPTEGSVGNSYNYYVNTTAEMMAYSNVHDWSLSPYVDKNAIYDYDYWASAGFYAQQEGSYQISATAQNACGIGYGTTYIWINYYRDYSIALNPASSEVAITLIDAEQNQDLSNAVHDVSICNMFGIMQSNHKFSGARFTVPVHNLKDGTYIVKLITVRQL